MVAAIEKDNTTIIFPEINVPKGHKYSAKLCVKNTICMRLKNNTSASKLTLSFITKTDNEYDSKKQMTIDIEPNSGYRTYYVNLSNAWDCGHWKTKTQTESCDDYLAGFKINIDGAETGSIAIDAIRFEREDRAYDYAAESMECTAAKADQTVTVAGKLKSKYAGKNVTILRTEVTNYSQLADWSGNEKLTTAAADANGGFNAQFPLMQGDMTHLSSWFLAVAHDGDDYTKGTLLGKAFQIENYTDFYDNKYKFDLPDMSVDVTSAQFGAAGDAFTNDTQAIQAAIDFASSQGGGKVVIPGDDSPYGRRYVITGLKMKDNVELCIEKGAVLYQSPRRTDYTEYDVYYGHENMGANVAWGLSALMHYPFIYINDAHNIKITGGGEIRMNDMGSENLDGNGYSWDSNIMTGCMNVIHLIPIGVTSSTNIEIRDLTVKRGNNWHTTFKDASNIYIGNVNLTEINDINADGFSFQNATNNVQLYRSSLYSNDDAVVICSSYKDQRDDCSIWSKGMNDDSTDKSIYNIDISGCNLFGGHGITFIPWASNYPDESKVEIIDIKVEDCVLGGSSTGVGAWADNPFYGKSNNLLGTYGSTDAVEEGDYSPIRNVLIRNNIYSTVCSLYGMQLTSFITDCGLYSASQFQNGNFDKKIHKGTGFDDETLWVSGLSYWSHDGITGTEKIGTKQSLIVNSNEEITQDNYAGYIKGEGRLYQGLFLTKGKYSFSFDAKSDGGKSWVYVQDMVNGDIITKETIDNTADFKTLRLDISIPARSTYALGVIHEGDESQAVYIDNASVEEIIDENKYAVGGDIVVYDFSEKEKAYEVVSVSPAGVAIANEQLTTSNAAEHKIIFPSETPLEEFMVSVDIDATAADNVNAGIYIFAKNAGPTTDNIDALNVHIEQSGDTYIPRIFTFSSAKGYGGCLASGESFTADSRYINLKAVVTDETLYVFVNGSETPCIRYILDKQMSGDVGLRSMRAKSCFDNFTIQSPQYKAKFTSEIEDDDKYLVGGETVVYDFSKEEDVYEVVSYWPDAVSVRNGELVASDGTEHKIIFPSMTPLEEFMVSVDINVDAVNNVSCGLYVFANNAQPAGDVIDALSIYIGRNGNDYNPAIYKFTSDHGYDGCVAIGDPFTTDNKTVNLKAVAKDMNLYVFVNGSDTPCMTYRLNQKMSGDVGLRSHFAQSHFDNFTIQSPQYKAKNTSGIDEIPADAEQGEQVVYDLSGRRVDHPSATGIYIVNGKKVLVRI